MLQNQDLFPPHFSPLDWILTNQTVQECKMVTAHLSDP